MLGEFVILDIFFAAGELAKSMKKKTSRTEIPLRKIFVCNLEKSEEQETPLHRLNKRGGGNGIATKLYLGILWATTAPPYAVKDIPASGWASLLGLEDPEGRGKRSIYNALNKLEKEHLVAVRRVPGRPPEITLLLEDGSNSRYLPPGFLAISDKAGENPVKPKNIYFKVPADLWIQGIIPRMSGAGMVMYLILLSEQADQKKEGVWFSQSLFQKRYNFDERTRAKGINDLKKLGVIAVDRVLMDAYGNQAFSLYGKQLRNVYKIKIPNFVNE